jgi:ATP-dependent helicase/nuclease subunit A
MSGASAPALFVADPAQRAAADPRATVFVVANAGSGKTSTLVDRVARLLLTGTRPAEILCVTYTKAAAAEMQGRLYARLGEWAILDDARLRGQLAALDGSDADRLTPDDLSRARRLFARALETPGGLKIQTLHAFCEQLLRRFPLEAGVDPGFEVLDDAGAAELSTQAREQLALEVTKDPSSGYGKAYEHFAVTLDWQSFQDLLGRIEADRDVLTAWLERIADGFSPGPHRAFGLDGTETLEEHQSGFMRRLDRVRWLALAEEVAQGGKEDGKRAEAMRRADWTFAGIAPVFLTDGKPRAASRFISKQVPPSAKAEMEALQSAYWQAVETSRKIRTAEETGHVLALARVHAAFYELAKAQTGALDFADLIAAAVQLLTVKADAAWVLFKLDGGVDHVLLDEAQDTAPEQWEILKALTEAFFDGAGAERTSDRPRTVFAVGDEKQSIYSFQGARPERLREERGRYFQRAEGAGLAYAGVDLATSFRSTKTVLDFVDAVFDRPDRAVAAVGETGEWAKHVAFRGDQPGSIDLWQMHVDPVKVERDAWEPVDAEPEDGSRKALARDLAKEIKRQVEGGVAVHDKGGALKPAGYGDYLVLVRKRDGLFEEILRALKAEGVPVAGADRLMLSEHVAFHDLRAVARFALFPHDDLTVAVLRGKRGEPVRPGRARGARRPVGRAAAARGRASGLGARAGAAGGGPRSGRPGRLRFLLGPAEPHGRVGPHRPGADAEPAGRRGGRGDRRDAEPGAGGRGARGGRSRDGAGPHGDRRGPSEARARGTARTGAGDDGARRQGAGGAGGDPAGHHGGAGRRQGRGPAAPDPAGRDRGAGAVRLVQGRGLRRRLGGADGAGRARQGRGAAAALRRAYAGARPGDRHGPPRRQPEGRAGRQLARRDRGDVWAAGGRART